MKTLWLLLVAQLTWRPSLAMYHELSAKNFNPPTDLAEKSYFGYSFAYQQDIRSLMISAPRGENIGNIYSCNIDSRNCSIIERNIKRASIDYPHHYWLGATVKTGKDYVVTCAPRYVEYDYSAKNVGEFTTCYRSTHGGKLQQTSQISHKDRKTGTNLFEDKFDSFGWSIDIANDNSIIIGGPAMFTGRVFKYKKTSLLETDGRKSGIKYNFGYSVAAGNFLSSRYTHYAVGSPFGKDGHGEVVLLDDKLEYTGEKLTHEDVGTMFGAVLATAHIGDRAISDLLVGAPAYTNAHSYNVGAVYFYQNVNKRRLSFRLLKVITGQKTGSQFGSAIVSVGDLNGDHKDEIAIAAPYEDEGRGVVYLYCGSVLLKKSADVDYLQRIQPKENYHSFGLSLSALSDYDENGCNELAIGAPDNNTVVLYRCMSSVTLNVHAEFPNLQNRVNKTFFTFKSCVDVTYPTKLKDIKATIEVTVDVKHPSAALAAPEKDGKYILSLQEKKPQYCKDIGVNLPLSGNYDLKINYNISTKLLDSPLTRTEFDVSRVLLSDLGKLTDSGSVWAAECKDKNGCKPILTLRTSTVKTYLIGTEEPLKLALSIKNTGEVAYDACVVLEIQGAPILSAINTSCTHTAQSGQLKCAPRNSLHSNSSWESGEILLDVTGLTNKNKFVSVKSRLHDHCMKPEDFTEYNETITLVADHKFVIVAGETNIGNPIYMTKVDVVETGKQFQHIYTIINNGLINWVDVPCEVKLPKSPYINYRDNPVAVYGDSAPTYCDLDNLTASDSIIAKCQLTNINRMRKLIIVVSINIPPKTLESIIESQNITVETQLTLKFDGDADSTEQSVITKVELRDVTIPWWIILAATILGIFIILIIGLILYQCGFLRRQNKEKLKDLRKSVRRQTVRRSMMQQREEDRQRLTEMNFDNGALAAACDSPPKKKRVEIRDSQLGIASYGGQN